MRASVGRQVAFVGEVELSGHPTRNLILERQKGIIVEDAVSINEKYTKPRSVKLLTRFMNSCNVMPTFHDASGAVGHRFLYLQYQRSWAGREDRGLEERLMSELPGINNWALAGLRRLRANGGRFTVPDTAKNLADDFLMRSNPIHAFMRDRVVVRRDCDPGDIAHLELTDEKVVIQRDALFRLNTDWCSEHDLQAKETAWFSRDLANASSPNVYLVDTDACYTLNPASGGW